MNATAWRASIFALLLVLLVLAEWRWPRHQGDPDRRHRWPVNLGFGLAGALCLRLLMPWLAIDAALWARQHHVGLLHAWTVPSLMVITVPPRGQGWLKLLWRLHRLHHSDLALDASSGVRFHPLEILFSMGLKIAAVLALGAAPAAVLAFEIVLNGFAMFTHANLALPLRLDRALRWMVVTADMHRIHHSVLRDEHDSNFGFNVSWWDRLFCSYREAPRQPQATLRLGLDRFRDSREQRFDQLLLQPFRGEKTSRQ